MRTRRFISITIFGFLVISMLAFSMSVSAGFNRQTGELADYQVCYAIADEGGVGAPGADRLTQITYVGGVNGQEMLVGDPGTYQIEAITFDVNLEGGHLYGADGGQIGVFDLDNQGLLCPGPMPSAAAPAPWAPSPCGISTASPSRKAPDSSTGRSAGRLITRSPTC